MKQAGGKVILSLSSEQGKVEEWGWGELRAKTAPGLGCEQGQPLGRACFLQSRSASGRHTPRLTGDEPSPQRSLGFGESL